ncbi:FEN1-like nuclease (Cop-G5R) [Mythimna separata entomopoxvirus 'L']|uniref:FEN1-like nuclease (Cop-G5R) n=1 Tax=Mythimna separata entomopoxvirus 'L' TaxID=1293572 RepID=A0A916KQB5_9POXV|nr:FEN1-like nuclease (Cop-G5R) [Mythimna separata entomopoxvirus 'L']CCU56413.1 FEN1-like nuclease (Cop-G5R) [Mythimna separata entomopoxvirus 'L']
MGIKYLYKNLLALKLIKEFDKKIYKNEIFIDFDCLYYTYVHVSSSDNELINKIMNVLHEYLNKHNNITVFYDSGLIKKSIENNKRNTASKKYYGNIKEKLKCEYNMNDSFEIEKVIYINDISTQTIYNYKNIKYNGNNDDIEYIIYNNEESNDKCCQTDDDFIIEEYNICEYDVIKNYTETTQLINPYYIIEDKKQLYSVIFNLDKDKKINLKNYIIKFIKSKGFNVISKEGVDAELYMVYKCIKLHNKINVWPLCSSKDQDIIALSIVNIPYNVFSIIYDNKYYLIKKNILSISVVLLSLIFNESDYFGGIIGYSFNGEKIKKLKDIISENNYNNDTDYRNIEYIKNLCKNLILKTINQNIINNILKTEIILNDDRIEKYLSEIYMYLNCDKTFYNTEYNNQIDKNEFIKYLFK